MSDPDAMPRDWWEQEQEAMLDDFIERYSQDRYQAEATALPHPNGEEPEHTPEQSQSLSQGPSPERTR